MDNIALNTTAGTLEKQVMPKSTSPLRPAAAMRVAGKTFEKKDWKNFFVISHCGTYTLKKSSDHRTFSRLKITFSLSILHFVHTARVVVNKLWITCVNQPCLMVSHTKSRAFRTALERNGAAQFFQPIPFKGFIDDLVRILGRRSR
ncbi:MAG: hypothetical protein RBU27_02825 [Bacteroidota bacterium]|nr:hypothetical protein [Bacteroidota bacterium]